MIHFDFIVSDVEAQDIFEAITEEIQAAQEALLFGNGMNRIQTDEWWKSRINYLKELKAKMKNTYVETYAEKRELGASFFIPKDKRRYVWGKHTSRWT